MHGMAVGAFQMAATQAAIILGMPDDGLDALDTGRAQA